MEHVFSLQAVPDAEDKTITSILISSISGVSYIFFSILRFFLFVLPVPFKERLSLLRPWELRPVISYILPSTSRPEVDILFPPWEQIERCRVRVRYIVGKASLHRG